MEYGTDVNDKQKDIIKSAFLDPSSPVAYSSLEKVFQQCKSVIKGLTRGDVANVLSTEPEFTQYRKPKRVKGRKTIFRSSIPFKETAIDLNECGSISSKNKNVRYLFVFQDILTKYLIVIPIRSKNTESIRDGFDQFFSNPVVNKRKGVIFWSDQEAAVKANEQYLQNSYQAQVWYAKTLNKTKSVHAELSIRTLSSRINRYMSYIGKMTFIDKLQDIVSGINNCVRPELNGKSPATVIQNKKLMHDLLKQKIQEEIAREKKISGKKIAFRINDMVLPLNWPTTLFKKDFLPKFDNVPRKVIGIKLSVPPLYILEGLPKLRFYASQLSLVKRGSDIFSEKINKQKPQQDSRVKYKLIKTRLDPERKTRSGTILSYAKSYQLQDNKSNNTEWVNEQTYNTLLKKNQIIKDV